MPGRTRSCAMRGSYSFIALFWPCVRVQLQDSPKFASSHLCLLHSLHPRNSTWSKMFPAPALASSCTFDVRHQLISNPSSLYACQAILLGIVALVLMRRFLRSRSPGSLSSCPNPYGQVVAGPANLRSLLRLLTLA